MEKHLEQFGKMEWQKKNYFGRKFQKIKNQINRKKKKYNFLERNGILDKEEKNH